MFLLFTNSFINFLFFFFFKQKTAYEMRISDWSSDVCSSDLLPSVMTSAGCLFDPVFVNLPQYEAMEDSLEREAYLRTLDVRAEIGRASCRERVCQYV